MDDIELNIAIQQGDEQAFKQFFKRYHDPLLAYMVTFTHQAAQAEDIVQQAFMSLWLRRDRLHKASSPKGYLYKIAYNIYIDQYRKKKQQESIFDILKEKALRERASEDNELMENRIDKLKAIVESLPPRCKEILQLNKQDGLKYKEIAILLDISIKTVEGQMAIAFKKIREGFKNDKVFLVFVAQVLRDELYKEN